MSVQNNKIAVHPNELKLRNAIRLLLLFSLCLCETSQICLQFNKIY